MMVLLMVGCATAPETVEERQDLAGRARAALSDMQSADPSLSAKLASSYAYVVFPSVGEGGFIVGGTYGRGVVFQGGRVVGYADLKAGKIGLVAGGQTFDELVLFRDRATYDRMINQGLSFTAAASATALTAGVAAKTQFREGVAVFVKPIGGLMADLSLGGQKIDFVARYGERPGTHRY